MNARLAVWKRLARVLAAMILVLAVFIPATGLTRVVHAAGPYVVDTTADGADAANDSFCNDGAGHCTLRAALKQAFYDSVPTAITFDVGLTGATLVLSNTLGTIIWAGDNITVTGETRGISISGVNLAAGQSIFQIEGSHNLLENLTVTRAPQDGVEVGDYAGTGAGNSNTIRNINVIRSGGSGIYVYGGSSGMNNTITGSKIGATSLLSACGVGNNVGVTVGPGAAGTLVTANYIVCNLQQGVQITNSTSVSLTLNGIGIGYAVDLGNGGAGIYAASTSGIYLASNFIAGNGSDGILLENSIQAVIKNNHIGSNTNGTAAVPNDRYGVALTLGSNQNTIGGASSSDGNIISGNAQAGVFIDASNNNLVSGNVIGLNNGITDPLPNGMDGVWINNGSTGNTIGSTDVSQAQYIGSNVGAGILIISSDSNRVFASNRIGVGPLGKPFGNGDGGVFIIDSSNNAIYPTQVANNANAGIALIGNGSLGNDLGPAHVTANTGLPIDLGNDGPTPNDGVPDIGPNNFLDYPVINASASHVITGTTCNDCTVYVYQAVSNPAAPEGGADYLGSTVASPSGNWNYTLTGNLTRLDVTLQARDLAFNTSEFSPRPVLFLPLVSR